MRLAAVSTRAQLGMRAPAVTVEVAVAGGLSVLAIVGLVETAVRESRERVAAALKSSGFELPAGRITVNLAPADLPKAGGRFDLAIALGILAASGQLPAGGLDGREFFGELAFTGELRPVPALLPALLAAGEAGHACVLPSGCAGEAGLLPDGELQLAPSLLEVVRYLRGEATLAGPGPAPPAAEPAAPDLAEVRGQLRARRALEIAAAGGHNLLLVGPPGTGKSLLAQRLAGLLPDLDQAAAVQLAVLQSLAGSRPRRLSRRPPCRAPHHTASAPALVGGGRLPRPGEVSLAHAGVLFLDELPQFARPALEALREPLETGAISIARAGQVAEFPASFQLVAAMNPCPCGFAGDPQRPCRCSPEQVARYQSRVSGPLLDRMDLCVTVAREPLAADDLVRPAGGEASAPVRARVAAARGRQSRARGRLNAQLRGPALGRCCRADVHARELLATAAGRLTLSARACDSALRVARTIADLEACETVRAAHVSEALSLRLPAGGALGG